MGERIEAPMLASDGEYTVITDGSLGAVGDLPWGAVSDEPLFTITWDGDVILGSCANMTEAAQRFWDEVERLAPAGRKLVRAACD